MKRHTGFYKAVRNLLFNELGVSREMIEEVVAERVDKVVKERLDMLFETNNFQIFVRDAIARTASKRYPNSFDDFFRQSVSAAAANFCREHLKVEWKDSP